jgi:hypothetical protein
MYRYLGRCIDTSGFDNWYFLIVLMIDGIKSRDQVNFVDVDGTDILNRRCW